MSLPNRQVREMLQDRLLEDESLGKQRGQHIAIHNTSATDGTSCTIFSIVQAMPSGTGAA